MAAQGWFEQGDIDVTPGTTAVLQLTVMNLADTTDSFVLTPVGMAAGYTTIEPATITLFGGSQETVDLQLRPPMLPSTTAGPTSLSVRIVPQHDPDNIATAETTIIIGGSFDRRISVLQPAQRGRRGAGYEMMVENKGNTQASVRLHLIDPTGRIEGDFDPPAAGIEPGGSTLVRLKLRAKGLQWERRPRTIPFRIDADQPGSPTASAPATFIQAPMVPERLYARLAGAAVAAGLLAAAWFGLIRPEIRSAAERAVADATPATTTTVVTPDSLPGATGDAGTGDGSDDGSGTAAVDEGEIVNLQLPVAVAVGQTGANQYTVPAGKVLRVTDLIIQNPQVDQGTLVIGRNAKGLLVYNLGNVFTDAAVPLVTPLELQANEQLTVTVTCLGLSDQTVTSCNPTVLASGVLVDA